MTDIAVIVLAAGAGTRMKSKTPKILHTLAGRSRARSRPARRGGAEPEAPGDRRRAQAQTRQCRRR